MTTPPLPEQIELHRDRMWRRDEDRRIESVAVDAERFIEDVGFANTLTEKIKLGSGVRFCDSFRRRNRAAVSAFSPMLPRSGYAGSLQKKRTQPHRGCAVNVVSPQTLVLAPGPAQHQSGSTTNRSA
jgi:hypothetical protein